MCTIISLKDSQRCAGHFDLRCEAHFKDLALFW